MNILINASTVKKGGGLQVTDSVCRELFKFPQHHFIVVYYKALAECAKAIMHFDNVEVFEFETPIDVVTVLAGRCKYLDDLVEERNIDVALTIFGPSRWIPKVPHLSGFAVPHLVFPESPYWEDLPLNKQLSIKWKLFMVKRSFAKSSNNYFTENPLVSQRLKEMFPQKNVFTVTNNANQVFGQPEYWDRSIILPKYDGITLLTVSANYPHKNLPIIIPTCHYLEKYHPHLNFRFVLTISKEDLGGLDDCTNRHILFLGPVKIQQVPYLYEQSDVMVLPTLLECFSASYAEAMMMKKPIITTDLVFARGLCGDAALYFEAISPEDLGEKIVRLADDAGLRHELVAKGNEQIKKFDTFEQRAEKLISLVEKIVKQEV